MKGYVSEVSTTMPLLCPIGHAIEGANIKHLEGGKVKVCRACWKKEKVDAGR